LVKALTRAEDDSYDLTSGERVANLRAKLIWLEILDLEPLAPSTNLLGAILARLELAAGRYLDRVEPAPATLMDPYGAEPNAMRELVRLQDQAATAIKGNLTARAGGLDPDNFAAESRRAERHRMDLSERFAYVLSLLARQVGNSSRDHDQQPVFVLPVDDLDLNPTACVPLLELLRAVHSPHLFVILLADIDITQKVLRLHYQRRFIEVAGTRELEKEYLEDARDLAANALRKHFPPEHRISLKKADVRQALTFKPLGSTAPNPELWTLLEEVRLIDDWVWLPAVPGAGRPVAAPLIDLERLSEQPQREHYSWHRVFRLTSRELVDAYLDAASAGRDAARGGDPRPLARLVRARILTLAAVDQNDTAPETGTSQGLVLTAVPDWSRHNLPDGQVETATIRRWSATGGNTHLTADDQHTLAGVLDVDPHLAPDAEADAALIDGSRTARECPPLRRTLWTETEPVDWPMPRHSTCWGYEDAIADLADNDRQWQVTDQPDRWFGAWVETMTTVVEKALGKDGTADLPRDWEAIRGRLERLGDEPLARRWRAEVLALCTPEMGMAEPGVVWSAADPVVLDQAQRIRAERAGKQPKEFTDRIRRGSLPPPPQLPPPVGGPTP
jgi:hypothetical protein